MTLSPAERLLLAACSGAPFRAQESTWRDLPPLADKHGIAPLVFARLREAARQPEGTDVPEAILTQLGQRFAESLLNHSLACGELIKVLDALGSVPTLVLKGPALADLYPGGCRVYSDLDVAVPDRYYTAAREALSRLGYQPMEPYVEQYQRAIGRDLALVRQDEQRLRWSVELHWRLGEPDAFPLDEGVIWRHASPLSLANRSVLTPGPEDTLLLLVLNLRKHRFARLKTLCDIDLLLRRHGQRLDWDAVHSRAHAAGACLALQHSLSLATRLLGTPPTSHSACRRMRGVQSRLLARSAGEDVALREGREPQSLDAFLGLLPFLSVDRPSTAARLVYRRLSLLPEYASYQVGRSGRYRTRRAYLAITCLQVVQACRELARLLFVSRTARPALPAAHTGERSQP